MAVVLGIKPTMASRFHYWGAHDPGACLVADGRVVAMVEEERYTRDKHAPNPCFPRQSIQYVLDAAGTTIADVDAIAIGRDQTRYRTRLLRDPGALVPTSLLSLYRTAEHLGRIVAAYRGMPVEEVRTRLHELFDEEVSCEWYQVSHHRCHAASAAYCSGFDEQLTVTLDGSGEDDSTVVWTPELRRMTEFSRRNSIGRFYSGGVKYLGFRGGQRDGGKVMGLAAYGDHRQKLADAFDRLVSIGDGRYDVTALQERPAAFEVPDTFDELGPVAEETYDVTVPRADAKFATHFDARRRPGEELTATHADFAYHLQRTTEEIVTELVTDHLARVDTDRVALAGGVAMNCKLNRTIATLDAVEDLFVQPAANDPGICLGAALEGYRRTTGTAPAIDLDHLYYGPEYGAGRIESRLRRAGLGYDRPADICDAVADLLAAGNVVGWFQGRMEFGARALGNRSILADPTAEAHRDEVNERVKSREPWRPFAPSIRHEDRGEYLQHGDEAPFMILLDTVREEKRDEIPAVTHVDGTTRPQTVREGDNPRFHRLLSAFAERTGVPVVLNTSFNVSGEPIVESPSQAISTYYRTGLDALALGEYLLLK